MSGILTERQKDELHKSILWYLHASGMRASYDALKAESDNEDFQADGDVKAKWNGLLEKKWTSVIRLQKKIMDLESRNTALTAELSIPNRTATSSASSTTWLPRPPHRHTLASHRQPISRIAFHPVWTVLASASEDSTIKIWDWETGECERTIKGHTKAVMDVDFDPKGNMMVSASNDMSLKLWDAANEYKNIKTMHGHDHTVSSVKFTPSGDHVVSASRDKTIRVWEVATGYCVKTFWGHSDWVRSVVPSDDGRWLVTASSDQTARVWDATTGETKTDLRGHEHVVETAEFAPIVSYAAIRELTGLTVRAGDERAKTPGCFVATGSRDKSIRLWDALTGVCLRTFNGHDNWIRALVFHPSGKYLLSASDDKTVRIWDLQTGRQLKVIEAHDHFVSSMAWGRATVGGGATNGAASANGTITSGGAASNVKRRVNVLATASVDMTVRIWTP